MTGAVVTADGGRAQPSARAAPSVPGGTAEDPFVAAGREVLALAGRHADPRLRAVADTVALPPRLRLRGRRGVGVSSVAAVLRAAGIAVTADPGEPGDGADDTAGPTVLVITEAPSPEDRARIAGGRVALLVMTRADLVGTPPMATARRRCADLTASTGVVAVPVVAHLAAGVCLDDELLAALRTAATGTPPDLRSVDALLEGAHPLPRAVRARLSATLDLFGIAHAVAALRIRPDLDGPTLAAGLAAVGGAPTLLAHAAAALAADRHRRMSGAVAALRRVALIAPDLAEAVDATLGRLVGARGAVAAQTLRAHGAVGDIDPVTMVRRWYAARGGPLSCLGRACTADVARAVLRDAVAG